MVDGITQKGHCSGDLADAHPSAQVLYDFGVRITASKDGSDMSHTLDQKLNYFALRSFRDTADKDYVHARLAYRHGLIPQFYWSSLHCLEKYLKCILLLARVEARDIGHTIPPLLKRLNDSRVLEIGSSNPTTKFFSQLEQVGWARYLEVSWSVHDIDPAHLDSAVWEVRRYCQPLDCYPGCADLEVTKLEDVRGLEDRTARNTNLAGGYLEKVLENRRHPARPALVWNNFYYSTSNRKKVSIPAPFQAENAPLYFFPEIVDEVARYVKVSKDVRRAYRELAAERAEEAK